MVDHNKQNDFGVVERLTRFVKDIFKTNLEIFFEALKLSPNAQGYVSGSITELLLKRKLESEYRLEPVMHFEVPEGPVGPVQHQIWHWGPAIHASCKIGSK